MWFGRAFLLWVHSIAATAAETFLTVYSKPKTAAPIKIKNKMGCPMSEWT